MDKHICFVLDWYPTETNQGCVFAKHLICALADMGVRCSVVAPRILSPAVIRQRVPFHRREMTARGNAVEIYMPYYLHLTSKKGLMRRSMDNHTRAVLHTLKKYDLHPDAIYGHFIYQCGLTAARVGKQMGIPSFCACGESAQRLEQGSMPYAVGMENGGWKEILSELTGMICVSSNNRRLLIENGFFSDESRMPVFPNGVDRGRFHPMDRLKMREQLDFPADAFIVIFTGAFSERKGFRRLCGALKKCENVYSVFLGKGAEQPDCDRVLFCGSVPNEQVAMYLNAADVFVLPTVGEGCCNAIVEAVACGLPVISSDLPFNDDILNEQDAIRLDVTDEQAIADAICRLRADRECCHRMAAAAEKAGRELDLSVRAEKILRFIEGD